MMQIHNKTNGINKKHFEIAFDLNQLGSIGKCLKKHVFWLDKFPFSKCIHHGTFTCISVTNQSNSWIVLFDLQIHELLSLLLLSLLQLTLNLSFSQFSLSSKQLNLSLTFSSHLTLSLFSNNQLSFFILRIKNVKVDYVLSVKNDVLLPNIKLLEKLKINQSQLKFSHWVCASRFEDLNDQNSSIQNNEVSILILIENLKNIFELIWMKILIDKNGV